MQRTGSVLRISWGVHMSDGMPLTVTLTRIKKETPNIQTFFFEPPITFNPGQFVMVWVPGVDEIPMALSSATSITVQVVGDATVRYPVWPGGTSGSADRLATGLPKGRKCCCCRGVGAAPLLPLAKADCVMTLLLGARTETELLFLDQLDECTDVLIATDDGTMGHHGFVTALMDRSQSRLL